MADISHHLPYSWGKPRKTSARRPSDEGPVRPVIASNGVPFLQMRSAGSHSASEREKEGNKEGVTSENYSVIFCPKMWLVNADITKIPHKFIPGRSIVADTLIPSRVFGNTWRLCWQWVRKRCKTLIWKTLVENNRARCSVWDPKHKSCNSNRHGFSITTAASQMGAQGSYPAPFITIHNYWHCVKNLLKHHQDQYF